MKLLIAVVLMAAVGVAGFAAGRIPELRRRTAVEAELAAARQEIASAHAVLRLHALHDRIQGLVEATSEPQRFEEALTLSSQFFDLVRSEGGAAPDEATRSALSEVLALRDAVTAGLARHDPAIRDKLILVREKLHPLLREAPEAEAVAGAD
jgi:hypothetical protein